MGHAFWHIASQRTLTRMLDAGMIPYTRMGERSYRFLRLSDVTDYKRRRDEATSKALDEMRSIADEDGAYDIGMFQFHWDKATTRVAAATQRSDLTDARVAFSMAADEALAAAQELGRQSRRPAVPVEGQDEAAAARAVPAME